MLGDLKVQMFNYCFKAAYKFFSIKYKLYKTVSDLNSGKITIEICNPEKLTRFKNLKI